MGKHTKIEWAHHTFNAWIGCQKVGPACDHCYAEKSIAASMLGVKWGPHEPRHPTAPATWNQPKAWNREAARLGTRYRVFCNSLSDVFDNAVPEGWRYALFELIGATPNLDWMLLTKRIGNVAKLCDVPYMQQLLKERIWLGITVVNQEEANRDIPKLLAVPARVRFLSIEPMLGPIVLPALRCDHGSLPGPGGVGGVTCPDCDGHGARNASGCLRLHWVIAGGESGPHARPMHPDWVRSLRDQCRAAGVPFLFKQWGEWGEVQAVEEILYAEEADETGFIEKTDRCITLTGSVFKHPMQLPINVPGRWIRRFGKNRSGRRLDRVEHLEFPES